MNTRFLKINFYFVIFLIIGVSSNIYASHEFYGRIAIDSQSISNNFLKGTETDIKSNESKFGIKGNFLLSNNSNLKLVYQAEYGFDPIDGKARGDYGTFKKRNTFIGIQTDLGMLFAGTHDSAFKKSQLKVDLYNDLAPDIKNILHGENRLEDFIGYTTRVRFLQHSIPSRILHLPARSIDLTQSIFLEIYFKQLLGLTTQ